MSTVIDRAIATSKTYTSPSRREALVRERDRLTALHNGLLPVERMAQQEIAGKIQTIELDIQRADLSKELGGLPVLDPEIFSWTKPQEGWKRAIGTQWIDVPSLAFVPVSAGTCKLSYDYHGNLVVNDRRSFEYERETSIPKSVISRYEKTLRNSLSRHLGWSERERVVLTYTYPGIVPDDIRGIIQTEQQKGRFSHLAFICDVDRWQVYSEQVPRQYIDPILVGVKAGLLWALATFDPTPLETYIADEFAS